ncbi:MAG: hypothetical protein KGZ68_17820 [Dechloromonas sp.]|nr:hypothetical protein [Dechloromonas sp.]
MPLTNYHRFFVQGLVAQCEHGLPIPPESLQEVAVVSHVFADDSDPNVSTWAVFGVLADKSVDNLADCPTRAIAQAIADSLSATHSKAAA